MAHCMNRRVAIGIIALIVLISAPASAQVDFSGEWARRFWEDRIKRVPGPDIGDYLGLPINAAAWMRGGDTWDAR